MGVFPSKSDKPPLKPGHPHTFQTGVYKSGLNITLLFPGPFGQVSKTTTQNRSVNVAQVLKLAIDRGAEIFFSQQTPCLTAGLVLVWFWGTLPPSFQGSFFPESHQNPQKKPAIGFFLRRAMVEKNGPLDSTPRFVATYLGRLRGSKRLLDSTDCSWRSQPSPELVSLLVFFSGRFHSTH